MIYSNRDFYAQDREFDWGTLHQITMGEYGRGRKLITSVSYTHLDVYKRQMLICCYQVPNHRDLVQTVPALWPCLVVGLAMVRCLC